MRHAPIDPQLFVANRRRLAGLLPPHSMAIVNANDIFPTNADGTLRIVPNTDLFYLSGVEQEESILLLFPDADDERQREILFLRETSELIAIWEGHKLTREEARAIIAGGVTLSDGKRAFAPPPLAIAHQLIKAWATEV